MVWYISQSKQDLPSTNSLYRMQNWLQLIGSNLENRKQHAKEKEKCNDSHQEPNPTLVPIVPCEMLLVPCCSCPCCDYIMRRCWESKSKEKLPSSPSPQPGSHISTCCHKTRPRKRQDRRTSRKGIKGSQRIQRRMPFGRKSPLEALALPGVMLAYKYSQFRQRRREAASRRVTERELSALHHKIVSTSGEHRKTKSFLKASGWVYSFCSGSPLP